MPTIRNGRLLGGHAGDLHFCDGLIVDTAADDEVIEADGLIVSPGLIDIQVNGGFGNDFTRDPTTIWNVGEHLPQLGVTSFVPTIVSSPDPVTDLALDVVANHRPQNYRGADVLGLHFEGPWISKEMHGAHSIEHITLPDPVIARKWAESGHVRIVTLAPEQPGAGEVGEILSHAGVVVSVGHSAADYETATQAFDTYATLATHLFNQMSPFRHREPGVVGAALLHADACLLVVDGLHLATGTVQLAWKVLGEKRTILVTDAMAALGLGPGTYPLGDGSITVDDDGPRTSEGRLAGSLVTLLEAMAHLARATGSRFSAASKTVTESPARALAIEDRGRLEAGHRADFCLLDESLRVVRTFVGGEASFSR